MLEHPDEIIVVQSFPIPIVAKSISNKTVSREHIDASLFMSHKYSLRLLEVLRHGACRIYSRFIGRSVA